MGIHSGRSPNPLWALSQSTLGALPIHSGHSPNPLWALCRGIVVAVATLLFVWNARTHCQGPPCVEKSSSVDCRDDPVICVERTHALPGAALCREIVVAEATLLFMWNARTHCQ